MDYIIIYFSGTGNTELISNEIKKRLELSNNSVELVSIEENKKLLELDFSNKVIGFGYPVYKFSYPKIYDDVFKIINDLAINNKYFQYSTYARFNAYSFDDFSKRLDSKKFTLIGEKAFKSPSCGISCRKPKEDYEYESVMFFEDNIKNKIDELVEEIMYETKYKMNRFRGINLIRRIKKIAVKDIEKTKYPQLQINKDRCIRCGLCVNKCPDKNLLKDNETIRIIDDVSCLHCLRCMNHCAMNAISFGELTEGDNQYTIKIRDELYKKSINGYQEKYWDEFDKVIKKWRQSTLKYWLSQKVGKNKKML